jgi:hypothetical protein
MIAELSLTVGALALARHLVHRPRLEPVVVPEEHVGAEDNAATGEWLEEIHRPVEGSDEWWDAEFDRITKRFDEAIDSSWRRLDVAIRQQPHGVETVSYMAAYIHERRQYLRKLDAVSESTEEFPVVDGYQRAEWVL